MIKKRLIFVVIIALSLQSFSQNNFYDVDNVREIKMYFTQPNWDDILGSTWEIYRMGWGLVRSREELWGRRGVTVMGNKLV